MGTSGAYSGSGDPAGKRLRRELNDWLNSPPPNKDAPPPPPPDDREPPPDSPPPEAPPSAGRLSPETLLNVIPLIRPGGGGGGRSDGPGGGGGLGRRGGGGSPQAGTRTRGGAHRTAAGFAGVAGRAGAAAYAYQTGNVAALAALGLNYAELQARGSPLEVTVRIVETACGPLSDSTIGHEEERFVAGEIAEWVIEQGSTGATPSPEEIVRKAIALIIREVALSETGELARRNGRPDAGALTEREIDEVAEALGARAELTVDGATESEISRAVEEGIETLRRIQGDGQQ